MKKLIVCLLILCLAFVGGLTYLTRDNVPDVAENATETPVATEAADETAAEPEAYQAGTIDVDKLYASHQPEEIVLTVDGRDVTWEEYFSWLNYAIEQYSGQLNASNMQYGTSLDWYSDPYGDGESIASLAAKDAAEIIRQNHATIGFCAANEAVATEETKQLLQAQQQELITAFCGEGGTEEDLDEYFASIHMHRGTYDEMNEANALCNQIFAETYGDGGELIADEDAIAYMTENSYLHTNHILFATIDVNTGDELDDAGKAEKLESAKALYEELKGIEDEQALIKRFNELKADNCEDPGKATYPEGMTFASGTMVAEFETAAAALEDYAVCEPVETYYGYFLIVKLPMDPDEAVFSSSSASGQTGRFLCASEKFNAQLEAYLEGLTVEYTPAFSDFSLLEYVEYPPER